MTLQKLTLSQLEQYLSRAAWILKGPVDASDFKIYIFPLLFFKRLSDVYDEEYQQALEESDGDVEYAELPEFHRFEIPKGCHWNDVRENTTNVGQAIEKAFRCIEQANQNLLYGIFGDAQWSNKNKLSDRLLNDLIEHFSQYTLSNTLVEPDVLGQSYEYLIKHFADLTNKKAGEFYTPRSVVHLLGLILDPQEGESIYDPACGSGGMLTESQNFIKDEEGEIRAKGDVYLYGKEINDETYAICKSDMMIKGNNPENIRVGSTLSTDEFSGHTFDFMLSNPPYGKSWATDLKYIKDGKDIIDPRFQIVLKDYWGNAEDADATPRSSDGQLLFLMEMVDKMKPLKQSQQGSRIASVHNGSSLFTGDAGGGESNIRRYIIENDWLDCIVQLPNNLFYNTGITTYIWFLTNSKPANRKGKVILIDASQRFAKLRKNLGAKNCELTPEHVREIQDAYTNFKDIHRTSEDGLAAKVFDNTDFGYYKVTIDRPARLKAQFTEERIADLRFDKSLKEPMQWAFENYGEKVYSDIKTIEKEILEAAEKSGLDLNAKKRKELTSKENWKKQKDILETATLLLKKIGSNDFNDFNVFSAKVREVLKSEKIKLSASELNQIYGAVSWYDESAEKVIKKVEKLSGDKLDKLLNHLDCTLEQLPDFGYYPSSKKDEYIIYETQTDLRDSENVPLNESIHDYFLREVLPHVGEAWIDLDKTKIGYEISFNKYFYQHKPLRSIEEVSAEILSLEEESEGLIMDILKMV